MKERTAFVVRLTTEADVPEVVALMVQVAAEERWLGTEAGFDEGARAEQFTRLIGATRSASFVAVAVETGKIVGSLGIGLTDYGVAEFGMMVAQDWRRVGIGSALLTSALDWALRVGAHKVALQCWPHNEAALALYERHGFEREGYLFRHYRRRNGELWDAVVMGKMLVDGDKLAGSEAQP